MIKFRTRYDDDLPLIVNSPGSRLQDIYELDPDGSNEFDIRLSDKKKDIQDYIDSFKGMTDANQIIERFRHGDIMAIEPVSNLQFGDISDLPDNIQELKSRVDQANLLFDSLHPDIKAKFDSVEDFYKSVGSDRFYEAFRKPETIAPEVSASVE